MHIDSVSLDEMPKNEASYQGLLLITLKKPLAGTLMKCTL